MNPQHLSTEEIIRYVENGVIDSLEGEAILRVLSSLTERIKELEESLEEELASDAAGYDQGWEDAVSEMISRLEGM